MDTEDPDTNLDHSENLTISSFYLFKHILKISLKSVSKFFIVVLFTNKLTYSQTNKPRRKHNLLGRGNEYVDMDKGYKSINMCNQSFQYSEGLAYNRFY